MIPPRQQWCIQIDVTNACPRACSNCTRLLAHVREPFFMDVDTFERACAALEDFPSGSEPDLHGRRKVVGIIGGEPLIHPEFEQLVAIMCRYFPDPRYRGLWTGLEWRKHKHRFAVEQLLGGEPSTTVQPTAATGYLNNNLHSKSRPSVHQPLLVAISDIVADSQKMWEAIDACWVQAEWSSAITPKGSFPCEVMAAFDMVFGGPGGVPIGPECWRLDMASPGCQELVRRWCPQCGACLRLPGRKDAEQIDDVSRTNLAALRQIDSPRAMDGRIHLVEPWDVKETTRWEPSKYMKR